MTPVSKTELYNALVKAGPWAGEPRIQMRASSYMLPSVEYTEKLGKRTRNLYWELKLTWVKDKMHCTGFAGLASELAKLDQAVHGKEANIAVGVMYFYYPGLGHACVTAVHRIKNKLVVKLYEPQPTGNICLREINWSDVESLQFCYI